ncbi:hypothetical protein HN51_068508, partial [Arachis hypogaea]
FVFNCKDELHGLARDLNADSVFKNHDLNMDVLYHIAETQQLAYFSCGKGKWQWYLSIRCCYLDKDLVESLENGAEFWTDYSKVHYHLRNTEDFNNYGIGKDSFSWALQGEEISDSLRFFVEECDHIQGFQFVVDDSRGFSAVAKEFLENIVKFLNSSALKMRNITTQVQFMLLHYTPLIFLLEWIQRSMSLTWRTTT